MAEATDQNEQAQPEAVDAAEPKLYRLLLKDGVALFAALSLWAAADTWYQVTGLPLAVVLGIGNGILVGLLLSALFHEWGHYAGAKFSGAVAPRVELPGLTLFRYRFDFESNNSQQFHRMTYGGHVGHWSALLLILVMVPMDTIGRIALAAGAFGFIAFATLIEYNVVKDTWAGADPETRLNGISSKDFQQATVVGGIAGLFFLALLS